MLSTTHKVELALHHAEHAAGIMSLVVIAIVAGSGALATFSIWRSIAPQWRRIARLAAGNIEDRPSALQPWEARS